MAGLNRIDRAARALTILDGAYLEQDGSNVVPFRKPKAATR